MKTAREIAREVTKAFARHAEDVVGYDLLRYHRLDGVLVEMVTEALEELAPRGEVVSRPDAHIEVTMAPIPPVVKEAVAEALGRREPVVSDPDFVVPGDGRGT